MTSARRANGQYIPNCSTGWPSNSWIAAGTSKPCSELIVTSATYRQSSKITPELLQKDPDNRLLARGPRIRLGPEVIRDLLSMPPVYWSKKSAAHR